MKKHLKQLEYCRTWLERADLAAQQEKGYLWDAQNTIAGQYFPHLNQKMRANAERCRIIKEYAFSRYRTAVKELELLCVSKTF